MGGLAIRPGERRDLAAINAIYNHYIRETAITFDLEPWAMARREAWFATFARAGRHQLFVADDAGAVVGFAYSQPFRDKAAYDTTVETTIYLAPGHLGRGVGSALYRALFEALDGEDVRLCVAGVTLPNDASIALHRRFGFASVGVFREVGRKFGRYHDVEWFQRVNDPA